MTDESKANLLGGILRQNFTLSVDNKLYHVFKKKVEKQ